MKDLKKLKRVFNRSSKVLKLMPAFGRGSQKTTVRLGEDSICDIVDGNHQLVADPGKKLGGKDSGPTPAGYARAALGSCLAITGAFWAAKMDIPINSLEVEVENEYDARSAFDVGDGPTSWTALRYKVTIESDAPEKQVRELAHRMYEHSEERANFSLPLEMEPQIKIVKPKE